MRSEATRVLKETRALLIPWCVVMAACAFPLLGRYLHIRLNEDIFTQLGVMLGIPLLACFIYGNEFRNSTMQLLLSQPVDRMKIWREKGIVTLLATAIPLTVAVFSVGLPVHLWENGEQYLLVYFVVMICSAPFWTILARSTLGGLVLNVAAFLVLFAGYMGSQTAFAGLATCVLAYSAVMVWMGRHMLRRFQMTGGLPGIDLMTMAPNLMPERVASWLRCRSNEPIRNMVRKEVYLLKPLWMITALFVLVWIVLAISFVLVPASSEWHRDLRGLLVILSLSFSLIAMFLAASTSLGEEQESGVLVWHRTLPVSLGIQWWIKLLVSLIAGVVCSAAIPAMLWILGQTVLRIKFTDVMPQPELTLSVGLLIAMFFCSFWCATAVRGMTHAVLLLVSATGMIFPALWCGYSAGSAAAYQSGKFLVFVTSSFQVNPFLFDRWFIGFSRLQSALWPFVPVLLIGTIQAFPMFRRLPENGPSKAIRRLLPILLVTFLVSLIIGLGVSILRYPPERVLFYNVAEAVVAFQPDVMKLDELRPVLFTVEDLLSAKVLTPYTQRWLRNSTISVVAGHPDLSHFHGRIAGQKDYKAYVVTIHLSRGTKCTMSVIKNPSETGPRFSDEKCE